MSRFFLILIAAAILVPSFIGYTKKAEQARSSYDDIMSSYYEDYDF